MDQFPSFMKQRANRIAAASQHTADIEGFVFDGMDEAGSQMAFWTCGRDRASAEHAHDFDEYVICCQGRYVVTMEGREHVLEKGDELVIPGGVAHGGLCAASTRTIHCFGGRRARRHAESVAQGA